MNIIERFLFRAKTGAGIVNLGLVKEETIIRFKDYYIHVLENDEGLNLSRSNEPISTTDIPVREYWKAVKGECNGSYEDNRRI